MKDWNLPEIEKMQKQGKIRGFKEIGKGINKSYQNPAFKPASANTKEIPIGLQHIKAVLEKFGIKYVTEHQFVKSRKFRFDIAILSLRTAIEFEGLVATGKKGGHQTKKGYTSNCTKYNMASLEGWTLLRYTALNYKDFDNDITLLKDHN